MLTLLFAAACATPPPADAPFVRGKPTQTWAAAGVSASVIPWHRGDAQGRLIVAEIDQRAPMRVVPSAQPAPLQALLPDGDLVAINGGFYDAGAPMGLVVSAGAEVAPQTESGGSGVFVVHDAHRGVFHRSDAAQIQGAAHAVQSIDRLVDQGKVLVSAAASPARDARSAIGVRADGSVLMAILFDEDAVAAESAGIIQLNADSSTSGVSLRAWAELLSELGAQAALNLDGGYSTSIEIRLGGEGVSVVPHRATINAIVAQPERQ